MANKYEFLLDTLRQIIDDDTDFQVVNVYQKEQTVPTTKCLIYCNIVQDRYINTGLEQSHAASIREATVSIYGRFKMATSTTGVADTKYGDYVEKLEARVDALDTTLRTDPTLNTSSLFKTSLHSVQRGGVSGFVDDGSSEGVFQLEIEMQYQQVSV